MSYITDFTLRDTSQLDAFGRLRVSNPETLFDCTHIYDKNPLLIEELTASGASSTHLPNESTVRMDVTTTVGSRIVRQSKRYIQYQPGKSQKITLTGVLCTTTNSGITARIGIFDNHADKSVDSGGNGFFFEYSGGIVYVVQRSYVTGSQVDTKVAQADWNCDKLDGTGPSGVTLDHTKAQIFGFDLQWLGVGRVRLFIAIDGQCIKVHEFLHANLLSSVYTTRATLPIRYELTQVTGSATASMKMICSEVSSEGGYNPRGRIFSISSGTTAVAINTTEVPVIAIRLRAGFNRGTINPLYINPYCTTNDENIWRVYIAPNGTTTGGSWAAVNANSAVEANTTPTGGTFTGLPRISAAYVNQSIHRITAFENTILAAANIAGQSDEIVITAQNFSGAANVYCAIQFQEWV